MYSSTYGVPLLLSLSLAIGATVVSVVLVRLMRADRRAEAWEREVLERALDPDHDTSEDDQ